MKKALIAMSGGVDSSVAAYLIKKENYETVGVTLKLQNEDYNYVNKQPSCCSESDIEDARKVCSNLGIEYYVLDFKDDFDKNVISRFVDGYLSGETPNPCIDCNRYIKFKKMFEFAGEMKADFVVTGHYAQIEKTPGGRFLLKKGAFDMKDQSYVLYNLKQNELERIIFPIGELKKEDVRQIAEENGFINSSKPDSQDICFIKDKDYVSFIERRLQRKFESGDFVDKNGNFIAKHKGIISYTIGQRKGLGIASAEPYYVIDKDMQNNRVILGRMEDQFQKEFVCNDLNLIAFDKLPDNLRCEVKIRYKHKPAFATLNQIDEDKIKVVFDEPQKAVTKGQAAVFYDSEYVLGGGKIM